MESHTLWTHKSLLLCLVKCCVVQCWLYSGCECLYHTYACVAIHISCMPVRTLAVERGVWWMNCPALWKHACFPPPRHLKRMALSPPFWTPSLLSKTNGRKTPPTSCLASIMWTTSGSAFSLCNRETHSNRMGYKRLQPPLKTSCLGPLLLWVYYPDYPRLCLLSPSPAQHISKPAIQASIKNAEENQWALCTSAHVQAYVHMCACEWGLEGICYTSGVCVPHSFLTDIKLRQ